MGKHAESGRQGVEVLQFTRARYKLGYPRGIPAKPEGALSMNRKFLIMVMAICAATMLVSALLLPIDTTKMGKDTEWVQFIEGRTVGAFLLLFAALATLLAGGLFLGKTEWLDMSAGRHITVATIVFFVSLVFCLAGLIAGLGGAVGFWLYFLACIGGWGACMLTSNPDLAKRLASAATDAGKSEEANSKETKPAP